MQQQAFIGRVGTHFFLISQENVSGLGLYVFDTVTQTGSTKLYPMPKPLLSIVINEKSILFVSASVGRTGSSYHLVELNEEGNIIHRKDAPLHVLKEQVKAITGSDKKYVLLYQFSKKSSDSVLIRGSLLGDGGALIKQLQYGFRQDSELDAEPEVFVDDHGNTHILVYDKYDNYRISSDLTVNTIPLAEEQIISETFTFQKIKLKSLAIFKNNECNCMQAEGLYTDGPAKSNKGIYSIAFPLGRKNELAPRFIPFPDAMIKNFRRGFSATGEMIQNSIRLEEMVYSDSGSFAILRLNTGIPQKTQRIRPEDDPSLRLFNKSLGISRASDLVLPTTTANTTTRVRTLGTSDRYTNAQPLLPGMPTRSMPLSSRASGRNAPKFICVKLNKEQGFDWYESRSLDVFSSDYEIYNRVFLVGGEKEEIALVLYQADAIEEPFPVWITMKAGKQTLEKFPEKKLVFSPVQFLGHQQYGSLYLNTETGDGGLMIVQVKK